MDFERLINRHKSTVYRHVLRVCGNHDDAEDALADAILAAWKSADQLKNPVHFQSWLQTISSRVCTRVRIREKMMKSFSVTDLETRGVQIPDHRADVESTVESLELKRCVKAAMDSLPLIYREVYLRRELKQQSAERVAQDLNLSIPALKSRLHRARILIREALDQDFHCN